MKRIPILLCCFSGLLLSGCAQMYDQPMDTTITIIMTNTAIIMILMRFLSQ